MKYFLLTAIILFSYKVTRGQDVIVTSENEDIHCRITKVDKQYIYFITLINEEFRSTIIPLSKVSEYHFNYLTSIQLHQKDSNLKETIAKINGSEIDRPVNIVAVDKKNYPGWCFNFNGGYSYRYAPINSGVPSELKDYINKLRSGFNLDMDLVGYFSRNFGAGLKYSFNHASARSSDVESASSWPNLEDNVTINFIGPEIYFRKADPFFNSIFKMGFSIGYMGYRDSGTDGRQPNMVLKGGTLGINYNIGFDFQISKSLFWGFQISCYRGTITKLDELINDVVYRTINLDSNNYENLERLDFSTGIRFNW